MKSEVVFGTSSKVINLAPAVGAIARHPALDAEACATGQHSEIVAGMVIAGAHDN